MDEDRARRLAAIQSRLNPPAEAPTESEAPASGTKSGSGTKSPPPLFGAPARNLPKSWTRPSERQEADRRRELARILNRTVVRDSSYANAAGCVDTLLKIARNIQESGDAKYRTLKSNNPTLQKKVLGVPGGREFMILMGFHTETHNFIQTFVLDQSERRMYELNLAAGVLADALPYLQSRVVGSTVSKTAHKDEEAARVEAAKRAIEEDRAAVRERAERERLVREAREARARAAATAPETDGAESEEEPSVAGYTIDRRWGYGRRLDDDEEQEEQGGQES